MLCAFTARHAGRIRCLSDTKSPAAGSRHRGRQSPLQLYQGARSLVEMIVAEGGRLHRHDAAHVTADAIEEIYCCELSWVDALSIDERQSDG